MKRAPHFFLPSAVLRSLPPFLRSPLTDPKKTSSKGRDSLSRIATYPENQQKLTSPLSKIGLFLRGVSKLILSTQRYLKMATLVLFPRISSSPFLEFMERIKSCIFSCSTKAISAAAPLSLSLFLPLGLLFAIFPLLESPSFERRSAAIAFTKVLENSLKNAALQQKFFPRLPYFMSHIWIHSENKVNLLPSISFCKSPPLPSTLSLQDNWAKLSRPIRMVEDGFLNPHPLQHG